MTNPNSESNCEKLWLSWLFWWNFENIQTNSKPSIWIAFHFLEVEASFPYKDVQLKKGSIPTDIYDVSKKELGRGTFGTVFICKEKSTGLKLAAKFVKVTCKEDRRNMEREIEIMSGLHHPRIIQLYDAYDDGSTIMCILELWVWSKTNNNNSGLGKKIDKL